MDEYGGELLKSYGAKSPPYETYRFSGYTCISVTEVAAHRIPSEESNSFAKKEKTIDQKAMRKTIIFACLSIFMLSCNTDDEDIVRTENGKIWLSGGLHHCAEQIHIDNGTL